MAARMIVDFVTAYCSNHAGRVSLRCMRNHAAIVNNFGRRPLRVMGCFVAIAGGAIVGLPAGIIGGILQAVDEEVGHTGSD